MTKQNKQTKQTMADLKEKVLLSRKLYQRLLHQADASPESIKAAHNEMLSLGKLLEILE